MDIPSSNIHVMSYDVVVIGGGASGTALLYTLAHYTNISRLALVEKYDQLGQVNSNSKNNSQTLHVGDIETNFTYEKIRQVKPAASMLIRYAENLPVTAEKSFLTKTQKMVIAVGASEVEKLTDRYTVLKEIFTRLELLDGKGIAAYEPAVMQGRPADEPIAAFYNPDGYAVDFGALAGSFVKEARAHLEKTIDVHLGYNVKRIVRKESGGFRIETTKGAIESRVVVVDTDSYSLSFAKAMGYGTEYSLIPIAGTFYFSKDVLKGKVYTMQEPKLPFAAVHGDPDVRVPNATRWGPTARFFPVLESRNLKTFGDYLRSSGLFRLRTWKSFAVILFDPLRFFYLLRNVLYELPYIGKYFFISNVQKIVPTMRASDLRVAKGYGGMRLQRVDIETNELQLGEKKIIGENIIFNMTPSPGASVSLYNAMRDAQHVVEFLGAGYAFDQARMNADLWDDRRVCNLEDVSLKQSYSS